MDSSDEAGPAVTVAGMCPAIDRNRGREERERRKARKLTEIHRFKGRTTQEALFTSQNKECVCASALACISVRETRVGLWVLLAQES